MVKVLVFSGSSRRGSVNLKLVSAAADKLRDAGAEVTQVDLRSYQLPIYDGDLEADDGAPSGVAQLRETMRAHDAFLIGCPEYNGLITPLLKNSIDWVSRPDEDGVSGTAAVRGKVVGLVSASPGALGGLRGLVHVRALLGNIGMLVLPDQVALGAAHKAFGASGALTDEAAMTRLDRLVTTLITTTGRLQ